MSEGRERETRRDGGIQTGGRVVLGWEGGRLMQDKPVLLDHALLLFTRVLQAGSGMECMKIAEDIRNYSNQVFIGYFYYF